MAWCCSLMINVYFSIGMDKETISVRTCNSSQSALQTVHLYCVAVAQINTV